MNSLIDQRAAAFGGPASFDRARVVSGRAKPLNVRVGLKNLAQPSTIDGPPQKLGRIVEAVLAYHSKQDARAASRLDHFARRLQIGRNRLLDLNVLFRL